MNTTKFLSTCRSGPNTASHVSMIVPKGTFLIEKENLSTLYDILNSNHEALGVAEIPRLYRQLYVDIDYSIDAKKLSAFPLLYNEDDVATIVQIFINIINNVVDVKSEQLVCVLLEKAGYIDGDKYKNGFHLQWPKLFIQQDIHKTILEKAKAKIPQVDENVYKNAWLMYSCVKAAGKLPYKVSRLYDENMQILNINSVFGEAPHWPKILSIHLAEHNEYVAEKKQLAEPNMQQFISLFTQKVLLRESCPEEERDKFETACKILSILNLERVNNRNTWIKAGWILYNLSNASKEGLDAWTTWSSKGENFSEVVCESEWSKMKFYPNLGLGTLFYWAEQDNPSEIYKLKRERGLAIMNNLVGTSHYQIAEYLYKSYSEEFVCVNIKSQIWFQCVKGFWVEQLDPFALRKKISNDVVKVVLNQISNIVGNLARYAPDDVEYKALEAKKIGLEKLIKSLYSSPFKRSIISEAADLFFNNEFEKLLNSNPFLIGFNNGVFDLKEKIFRDYYPEDYISKRLPINYIVFEDNNSNMLLMHDFLSKIFPDKELRNYFVSVYSDIFLGGNNDKKILFWIGAGNNGKTIMQHLFELMLGNHCVKISTTIFTGKKSNIGAPIPELSRAAPPVRLITLEEPDQNEELNIGLLKQLTGNDKYWARDLYESGKNVKEITPFFKINFICNQLPRIKNADSATFDRIRVLPFESTFSDTYPSTKKEQKESKIFPKKSNMNQELAEIVEPFAYYLLKIFCSKSSSHSIIEPAKVKAATSRYRQKNDLIMQFFSENVETTTNKESSLSLEELWTTFQLWSQLNNIGRAVIEKENFIKYIEIQNGYDRAKWPYYKIKDKSYTASRVAKET